MADTTTSYQGRLDSGGQPHNGLVGMIFELYDAPFGGNQIEPTVSHSVSVTDGFFQVELDFGEQPYKNGRWLQITVNGQVLSPRLRGAPLIQPGPEVGDCDQIVTELADPMLTSGITQQPLSRV